MPFFMRLEVDFVPFWRKECVLVFVVFIPMLDVELKPERAVTGCQNLFYDFFAGLRLASSSSGIVSYFS